MDVQDVMRQDLRQLLARWRDQVVDRWVESQRQHLEPYGVSVEDLRREAWELLKHLNDGLDGQTPIDRLAFDYDPLRRMLSELSLNRARLGATPTETAVGILALKHAFIEVLREQAGTDPDAVLNTVLSMNRLVDSAALLTFETYVKGRQEIINRQNQQLLELSTPVVQVWRHVLAVPLIGTLDSTRTQVVMESLLQAIQDREARVAIIDITGVPTVDTLVAQHLLQTVTATRLMGAECVISGIRPQTAQTIVQLGIDLSDIVTRATLADALATAIEMTGDKVGVSVPTRPEPA
ncbi:Anti-sigma-factor antagonist [Carbonactinospora thermoautotrophica]|uniref:Anti-sigma-factor antagonist n=1 Tax=Carbonactinospora thermoautotrophica TaxID=1469144 RepID=A0A132MXP1_9ACTN|nr:STAS domain-containing protein [Carbonactinospora thermoautotrophica]KWX02619.1 Anti-sigma-factor antagonist [Carbonactinospora thermoautotrophica]